MSPRKSKFQDYSIVETKDKSRRGRVYFFITPKNYTVGDVIEVEGRPLAFSIHMREGGYVNIYFDSKTKKYRIYSWEDPDSNTFSVIYDCYGNNGDGAYPVIKGSGSYFIPQSKGEARSTT